jgi:phage terminase Nu1 subunit (DNA packaging protein)
MNERNHGGARKGAGRKPAGYTPPPERVDLEIARARNELAKAELNELELAIKRGEYVSRIAVKQETATAMATMAQTLRSVPDNLERKLGVSPEVAMEVGLLIDNALNDIALAFEQVVGDAEVQEEETANERENDYDDLL